MISANSFWIRLAEVERALEPKALEPLSLVFLSEAEAVAAVEEELEEDIFNEEQKTQLIWVIFKSWGLHWILTSQHKGLTKSKAAMEPLKAGRWSSE